MKMEKNNENENLLDSKSKNMGYYIGQTIVYVIETIIGGAIIIAIMYFCAKGCGCL